MGLQQDLIHTYIQRHPVEAARHLESQSAVAAHDLLKKMDVEIVASVLEYFLPAHMAEVLKHFSPEMGAKIINRVSTTAARAVLRQYETSTQSTLLSKLDPAIASYFRRTLSQPDHTAGSLADPRVLTLRPDITVGQALNRIGLESRHAIYYLYIIDHQTTLHGVVLMKELLAAHAETSLQSIMNQNVKMIPASASAQDLLSHPAWQMHDSLPVVEQGKAFIGVLRYRVLKKFLEARTDMREPEFLSDALLQLWEAYSLSGIGLMTTLGEVLKATREQKLPQQQEETR
ncbi:MAG: hypothetical protein NPIRA02_19900 [Nitrospirales bacterium]|nr:MAG: hypothetical protein NPIRA02_19900 [Nitrospirales bacterium]